MYQESLNFRDNMFVNSEPMSLDRPRESERSMIAMVYGFLFDRSRRPKYRLPIVPLSAASFAEDPAPLKAYWLGHSTAILEIDGVRIIIDPVFGNASPVPLTVSRFQDSPIRRNDLPRLDAVVISHDHYDHLEMDTIMALAPKVPLFIVPLGVGAHLEKWGCPRDKIVELDWWDRHEVKGVRIMATPSRHFSGRGMRDRFKTLWASFAFLGPKHRAYYSGDGGYDGRFKEIGEMLGPFDLTLLECGAYNRDWSQVHLFPEQTVRAHIELEGKYMLPVHWAAYDLSFHRWDEPIVQATKYAAEQGVEILTPIMGEAVIPGQTRHVDWWHWVAEDKM